MPGFLPAVLALAFATVLGTIFGAASVAGATAWQLVLVLVAAWSARDLDPFRLGPRARWLPWLLWGWLAVGCWTSPVSRAGWVGLVLLPCFVFLPSWVASSWSDEVRRRAGLLGITLVLGAVAVWALVDTVMKGGGRAAAPLGHPALLAGWLVTLLPLTLVPPTSVPLTSMPLTSKVGRLAIPCAVAGALALVASGNRAGSLALVAELALLAYWRPAWRRWLVGGMSVLALLVAFIWLARTGASSDLSLTARWTYLEAGWRGFSERALLGWGPGSVPWTIGLHLEPVPGVNPPGEVVGQLHSMPLGWLYELGLPGFLLVLAVLAAFVQARRREPSSDLQRAGLAGLAGAGVTTLFSDWTRLSALPVAVAIAAGAALADSAASPSAESPRGRRALRVGLALAALGWLAPRDLAHWSYQRACEAERAEGRFDRLERAVELDPGFALYSARLATVLAAKAPSCDAWRAAEAAPGVGPIWVAAGRAAAQCRLAEAPRVLERALALDSLGGFAPFELALLDPARSDAPACLARAFLAEPRLAASRRLVERRALVAAARREILAWDGVDPGWRERLASALEEPLGAEAPEWRLGLGESDRREEVSLFAFQRSAWPEPWAVELVGPEAAERFDLPPASALATSAESAFPRDRCSPRAKNPFDSAVTGLSH